MKEAIPNAEYIQAILDGKEVEVEIQNYWTKQTHWYPTCRELVVKTHNGKFRIKPEPAPKREPLTVHVYRSATGQILLWNYYKSAVYKAEYIGEFVLQPKEQT